MKPTDKIHTLICIHCGKTFAVSTIHLTRTKTCSKKCYQANRVTTGIEYSVQKKYREENRDKIRQLNKDWYSRNPNYYPDRYANDENFRLKSILRARLNCIVSGDQKAGSAVDDLGCSIDDFKAYFEKLFLNTPPHPVTGELMSWGNHGHDTWHIDHIIPLDNFNLSDPEQFKKANHYSNLQPLWAKDNYSKHNKLLSTP